MSEREHVQSVIFGDGKNESCVTCGVDLKDHVMHSKRPSVYYVDSDEFMCSYKCFKEWEKQSYRRYTFSIAGMTAAVSP